MRLRWDESKADGKESSGGGKMKEKLRKGELEGAWRKLSLWCRP